MKECSFHAPFEFGWGFVVAAVPEDDYVSHTRALVCFVIDVDGRVDVALDDTAATRALNSYSSSEIEHFGLASAEGADPELDAIVLREIERVHCIDLSAAFMSRSSGDR